MCERVVASMEVDPNVILLSPVPRSSLKVIDDSTNSAADNLGEIAKAFKATIVEDVRPAFSGEIPSSFEVSSFVHAKINWKETLTTQIFKEDVPRLKMEKVKVVVKVDDEREIQISMGRVSEHESHHYYDDSADIGGFSDTHPFKRKSSIVVIGRGMAEIAVAHALHDVSFQVVLLESRDRIVGRVCTDYSFGFPIDLVHHGCME